MGVSQTYNEESFWQFEGLFSNKCNLAEFGWTLFFFFLIVIYHLVVRFWKRKCMVLTLLEREVIAAGIAGKFLLWKAVLLCIDPIWGSPFSWEKYTCRACRTRAGPHQLLKQMKWMGIDMFLACRNFQSQSAIHVMYFLPSYSSLEACGKGSVSIYLGSVPGIWYSINTWQMTKWIYNHTDLVNFNYVLTNRWCFRLPYQKE